MSDERGSANRRNTGYMKSPERGYILQSVNRHPNTSGITVPKPTLPSPPRPNKPPVEIRAISAVSVVNNGHFENGMGLQSEEFVS